MNHALKTKRAGQTWLGALTLVVLLGLLGWGGVRIWQGERHARDCMAQLRQFYIALELYELDYGRLPHMAFYPDDAWLDPHSLLVVLDPYGVTSEMGLCPHSHHRIRKRGLSYVWNTEANGRSLQELDPDMWLITGINALSHQVRRPHIGRHITLYADGRVLRSRRPPPIH